LPIFELSKALGVGRSIKLFFSLYGGATRGEVPESPKQLRHLVEKQRGILKH
jgi:hypothetical protein